MLMSVESYKNSLNDGRAVYYRGKSVENVAAHPALGVPVSHASGIYRLQQDSKYENIMCFTDKKIGKGKYIL